MFSLSFFVDYITNYLKIHLVSLNLQAVFLFYVIQYIPVTLGENYTYPWYVPFVKGLITK